MCGIVGILAFGSMEDKKAERMRQFAMRYLGAEILKMTQERGKDATGIATLFDNGDYMGLKMGIPAEDFAARFGGNETDFEGFMSIWRRKKALARAFIGHCRKSSVGNSDDNKNNHPIKVGDIVGIHNGTLTNHDEIFKKLGCGRDGTVDSEAIFRLVHHYTNNGTVPFTLEALTETCKRLTGTYSCLTFSGNNPFQVAAFRDGRPMEFAIIKPLKLVVIASEVKFLKRALYRYNQQAALYTEGGPKLPIIKKADASLHATSDDHIYIFDLRTDITDDTAIGDLLEKVKTDRLNKMWKAPVKTTGYGTAYSAAATTGAAAAGGAGSGGTGKKGTEVTASKPSGAGTGTAKSTAAGTTTQGQTKRNTGGLAWRRSTRTYGTVSDDEEAACHSLGNVTINNETGGLFDQDKDRVVIEGEKNHRQESVSPPQGNVTFTQSKTPVDNLIDSPATITEVPLDKEREGGDVTEEPAIIAKHTGGQTQSPLLNHLKRHADKDKGEPEVHTIDFSTHPDVLEMAEEATHDLPLFSNDGEVQEALEIHNAEALRNMTLYSLANRIKKFFFRSGFYAGYLACLANGKNDGNEMSRNLLIRARTKVRSAQATLRQSKQFLGLLSRIGEFEVADQKAVNAAVATEVAGDPSTELTIENFRRIVKAGDQRKFPLLHKIATALTEIEGE